MSAILSTIFSIPVPIRALIAAGGGYLLLELIKPGFAFKETPDGYIAKPFGFFSSTSPDEYTSDEDTIGTTNIPWWLIPLGIFGFFVLFV